MANRLAQESSPYLLQHKDNPVDWFPWGSAAFEAARRLDRPVLLSIGYSACHWCHVMAHESFEDEETARFMNGAFVNVKVDREERPDVDALYMRMVQLTTGQGGWPLTAFLLPDGRPFFGGTYFPPRDRMGLPGFMRVMSIVAEAYSSKRDDVERTAQEVRSTLEVQMGQGRGGGVLDEAVLEGGAGAMLAEFDAVEGGFGTGMKFPQAAVLEYLLSDWERTGTEACLEAVALTLRKMALGGIWDHLGGGFARYAVDRRWRVPHFEKMLYDNAQLAKLYCEAWQATGEELFRATAGEALGFCVRELRHADGGFFAALDADSEGVEGKYYAWGREEFLEAAGADAELAARHWGVTAEGDYEHGNVLRMAAGAEKLAAEMGVDAGDAARRLEAVRAKLLERRGERVRPQRDEKVVLSWNALMIGALAHCGGAMGNAEWVAAAEECAEFVLGSMVERGGGRLLRSWTASGGAGTKAFLEDYALLVEGLLALYQACLKRRYLEVAQPLAAAMVDLFWEEGEGVFYDTGRDQERLVVRPRDVFDGALPSGGAAAAVALLRLAAFTGDAAQEGVARRALESVGDWMRRAPMSVPRWLLALGMSAVGMEQVVVAGAAGARGREEMLAAARAGYAPRRVLGATDGSEGSEGLALFRDRAAGADGAARAYVCRGFACDAPVGDAGELAAALSMRGRGA